MRFITTLVAALLALSLISCDDGNADERSSWEILRDGIPSAESLTLKVPESEGSEKTLFFSPDVKFLAAPGNYGELYIATVQITREVNAGVMFLLSFTDEILLHPPTEETVDTAIWGPFPAGALEPVEIRVIIKKVAENEFEFSYEARPKTGEGDWVAWYHGANKTDGRTARRGKGEFLVDFDAMRKYNPTVKEEGVVRVAFDTITSGRSIEVEFDEFKGKNDAAKFSATYHYKEAPDLSGEFDFVTKADIHKSLEGGEQYPEEEDWLFNTRWLATGAGRSDVTITGGDMSKYCEWGKCLDRAVFSECWGEDFLVDYSVETYYSEDGDTMGMANELGGPSSCAFPEKTY
ncbi:MAG: hypothetical protein Kow0090_02730 [Myxococcota bacterium]